MSDLIRRIGTLGRPIWLYLAIALAAVAFGWPLCRRAIILSDEGYLLQQALDLLGGRVLYRDMDAFITPGIWFALAGVFALFDTSVITSRVLILFVYVALALTGYRIVAPAAGRAWGFSAVAGLFLFSVWAFPAWTFAFYSPVAIVLALAAFERLLAWQRDARARNLVWTGFLVGMSVCFKQNYGVFASLAVLIGYLAIKLEARAPVGKALAEAPRDLGRLAGGAIAAGLPFLLYLVANGAIADAWTSLVVHPFEFGGRHDIPYLGISELWNSSLFPTGADKLTYLSFASINAPLPPLPGAADLVPRLHVALYWLAPLVIGAGLVVSVLSGRSRGQRIDALLFTVASGAGLIFLGTFPRADFNHLLNVYQPLVVLTPLVLQRLLVLLGPGRRTARIGVMAAAGIAAILYGGLGVYWYAALLERLNTPVASPRAGVWVTPLEAMEINYQVRMIQERTPKDSALLTLPDLTMLNFLTERPVPSAFYNLYEHHIAGDEGRSVVTAAEERNVQFVVARYNNFFSDRVGLLEYAPDLAHYLVTHFERSFVGSRENYIAYQRRDEPAEEHPHSGTLGDCATDSGLAEVREHLLFAALYHRQGPDQPFPEEGLSTRCRVQVPEAGGILALELGYRKPLRSSPGTRLQASIDVLDGDARSRILDRALPVTRWRDSPRQQPFKRLELDLGPWAGRAVDLEFRTRLVGSIRVSPWNLQGFAMIYRDPRVQTQAGGAHP